MDKIKYVEKLDKYATESPLDLVALKEQAEKIQGVGKRLNELGEKFIRDKRILEEKMIEIDNTGLNEEHRSELKKLIQDDLVKLEEQYNEQVVCARTEALNILAEISSRFQAGENEAGNLAESIGATQLSVATVDTTTARDSAKQSQREYEHEKFKNDEALSELAAEMERQNSIIRTRR